MNNSVFKAETFKNQEELNEFILKNEEIIKIIKVEQNGDRRALFFEEKKKYNYTEDYGDYGYGVVANDYDGWNKELWKKKYPNFMNEYPFD